MKIEKLYSLFLTEKCNRKCWHCDIPLIKNPESVTLDNLKRIFEWDIIKRANLTGGEIGILDQNIFEYLFSLGIEIHINTNGLFLKRFPEYYSKVSSISLHPSIDIEHIKVFYDPDCKITYNYPLFDDLNNIEKIVDEYKHLTFNFSPMVQKYEKIEEYSKDFYKRALTILYDKKNVTQLTKTKLLSFMVNKQKDKKECLRTGRMMNIDLVNNKIQSCYTSHSRSLSIELTKENLLNPLFLDSIDLCNNCKHIYGY